MSVRFDAATDQISRTTAPNPASGWTLTAWVYLSVDRDDYSSICRMSASGSTSANLATDANGQSISYFTAGGSLFSPTTMSAAAWYRVAMTVTGTSGVLYTATDVGSTQVTSGTVGGAGSPDNLTIGGRGAGDTSEWWNGRVVYARMWTAVLSQSEIEAEWASTTPVRTSGLWADWPLTAHTDLTDHSGNGRDLTAGSTAVTTEGDPSLATNATVTPAAVAGVAVVPAATPAGGAGTAPAAVAVVTSVPAATVATGSRAAPAAVAAAASVPATAVAAGQTSTPATVAASVSVPDGSVHTGSTVAATAVAATAVVPAGSVQVSGTDATVSPAAVGALATVPGPAVATSAAAAPSAVRAAVAVPAVTITVPTSRGIARVGTAVGASAQLVTFRVGQG